MWDSTWLSRHNTSLSGPLDCKHHRHTSHYKLSLNSACSDYQYNLFLWKGNCSDVTGHERTRKVCVGAVTSNLFENLLRSLFAAMEINICTACVVLCDNYQETISFPDMLSLLINSNIFFICLHSSVSLWSLSIVNIIPMVQHCHEYGLCEGWEGRLISRPVQFWDKQQRQCGKKHQNKFYFGLH